MGGSADREVDMGREAEGADPAEDLAELRAAQSVWAVRLPVAIA